MSDDAPDSSEESEDRELTDLTGTEPIATNPELEKAIDANPNDVSANLVYADWLSERDDPRGELITCSKPDASQAVQTHAEQLRAKHQRYFMGSLADQSEFIRLTWSLGWIAAARIAPDYDTYEDNSDYSAEALRALMGLYSARFIQNLSFGATNFEGDTDFSELFPILVKAGARPTMHTLFFGDSTSDDQEVSWMSAGTLAPLVPLYPNLKELHVYAGSMDLADGLAYPKLQTLKIESGGTSKASVLAVANASLPELTYLDLWTGARGYGATSTVEDMAEIFSAKNLPKVRHLGLMNCEYADDICSVLPESKILAQLEELDLSMGLMTDVGIERLLSSLDRFKNLKVLDVSQNYLTDTAIASLESGLGIKVKATRQKTGNDYRYVSVGE